MQNTDAESRSALEGPLITLFLLLNRLIAEALQLAISLDDGL